MPGGFSLGHALVVAGVLHVALILVGDRVRRSELPRPPRDSELTLVPIEVEPEVAHDVTPPPPESPSPEPQAAPSIVQPAAVASRASRAVEPQAASSAVALPETAPLAPGGWTLRVTTGPSAGAPPPPLAALALDGHNQFMGRRETPEDEQRAAREQANRAAGEAMRGALHDNDVALGLGGGGPVVSALEAAVRESTAPDESRAVLVAFADASGTVLRVDVESATDNPAYRAIAEDVLQRLRGQKVRVPSGSHGIAMRIDVASKLAMPSGGGIGLDPRNAGMHFDIADLGAHPHRVIHARVLNEQLL